MAAGAITAVITVKMCPFHVPPFDYLKVTVHVKGVLKCTIMAAGETFVIMDSLTQQQELFVTCSDMDTSGGLLVTGMVDGAVLFGWTTFCAMEPKTALENVDIVAGRDMTVQTGNEFQFYASHLQ